MTKKKAPANQSNAARDERSVDRTAREAVNIDYRAEGDAPPDDRRDDPTDAGYDRAAHGGSSRYGVLEGRGGVFGTSGGGTYPDGFNVEERPGPEPRDEPAQRDEKRAPRDRHADRFEQVNVEDEKS